MDKLDETHHDDALANESHKKHIKSQHDKSDKQAISSSHTTKCMIRWGKVNSSLCGMVPISKRALEKGAYELVDYNGVLLGDPRNGIFLKRNYA